MLENKTNKLVAKEYPLEDVHYEQLNPEKEVLVQKLCYLFVFYAAKGSKHAYYQLQEHYFMELMAQVWEAKGKKLLKNKGEWKDLQLLYHTIGIKHSASFKNFLELLPTIGVYSQPDMNRQDSLKSLMHHLINVYEAKVMPEIEGKLINIDMVINKDTSQFISKLTADLTKLYKLYFPHEINHKVKTKNFKNQSIQCYFQFLKDFQVFPKVISARDIFYIFNQACQSNPSQLLYQSQQRKHTLVEQGQVFKLSKFIQSLITVSKRAFPKLKQVQNQQQWQNEQKYILRTLLQYMQTVKTTNKKKTKFMNERFCFIVLEQHPEQQMLKTIQVKDKLIKQPVNSMSFFNLMDKLTF